MLAEKMQRRPTRVHLEIRLAMALAPVTLATQATAAPADESTVATPRDFEVELIALAATDFRFRGVSFSDNRPVFQPELTISHESGFYVDFWTTLPLCASILVSRAVTVI